MEPMEQNNAISFVMSLEDFTAAFQLRQKTAGKMAGKSRISSLFLTFLITAFCVAASILWKDYFLLALLAVLVILELIFRKNALRSNAQNEFLSNPIYSSPHSLRLFAGGLDIINGFEKCWTPWKEVFQVVDSPRYLLVVQNPYKAGIAIDKQKVEPALLDRVCALLQQNLGSKYVVKGGK